MVRKRFDVAPKINVKDEGMLIQQAAGSTANLLEIKDAAGNTLVSYASTGIMSTSVTPSFNGGISTTVVNASGNVTSGNISTGNISASGNITVGGNLIVSGNTVTFDTETVVIEDKNIVLGNSMMASNVTADGGGITLAAGIGGNKTFNFVNLTSSWTSSEHIDIINNKGLKLNGNTVLESNNLNLQGVGVFTTEAAQGRGVAIRGGSGNTQGILQFLNNPGNAQWGSITANSNGTMAINATTVSIPNLKGSVIQYVSNPYGTQYTRGGASTYADVPSFNCSITPKSNTSVIVILVQASAYSICDGYLGITRSGVLIANPLMSLPRIDFIYDDPSFFGLFYDSPGTTSSITYQIQSLATGCSGYIYINANGGVSRIVLLEIAA